MVKVAYGLKNTHSKYGDNRMISILKSCKNYSEKEKATILNCNTTDEAIEYLKENKNDKEVLTDIAIRCKTQLEQWTQDSIDVEIEIFSTIYGTLYPIKELTK